MFKNNNTTKSNLDIILKYFTFYSLFIFFIVFNSSSNFLLKMLPDFSMTLIFFNFLWNKNSNLYSVINLFILGLIMDVYSFTPMFLSSFCLLLTYKIFFIIKNFLVNDKYLIYFVRDTFIFFITFFVIKWFILSYYNLNFLPFSDTLFNIIFNILYCIVFYIFYNKAINNV